METSVQQAQEAPRAYAEGLTNTHPQLPPSRRDPVPRSPQPKFGAQVPPVRAAFPPQVPEVVDAFMLPRPCQ